MLFIGLGGYTCEFLKQFTRMRWIFRTERVGDFVNRMIGIEQITNGFEHQAFLDDLFGCFTQNLLSNIWEVTRLLVQGIVLCTDNRLR